MNWGDFQIYISTYGCMRRCVDQSGVLMEKAMIIALAKFRNKFMPKERGAAWLN